MVIERDWGAIGGAEVFVREVATRLVSRGHRVRLLASRAPGDVVVDPEGIDIRYLPREQHRAATLMFAFRAARALRRWHQERSFDVVHATLAFPGGFAATQALGRMDVPILVTVQGGDMADYPETPAWARPPLRRLAGLGLSRAHLVHAVSRSTQRDASVLGAPRCVVIPNGVGPSFFVERPPLPRPGDPWTIASISRLAHKNGLDLLIQAIAEARGAGISWRLLIVGSGEEEGTLRRLVARLGLTGLVEFAGRVRHEDLPAILRTVDIHCRPSREEGFGIAFLESMAAGVPTIGTRVGGIPDIIEDGKTGFLVPPEDVGALAAVLVRIARDPQRAAEVAKRGQQLVRSTFGWPSIVDRIEGLYGDAMAEAGKRAASTKP